MVHNAPMKHGWFVSRRVRCADFQTRLRAARRFYRPSPRWVFLRLLIPSLVIIVGLILGALFLDRPDMSTDWRGAGLALAAGMIGMGAMALYMASLVTLFPRAVRRVSTRTRRKHRGLRREHRRGLPPMWAKGAAWYGFYVILVSTSMLVVFALMPPRDEQAVYIMLVFSLFVGPLLAFILEKWNPFRLFRRVALRALRISPSDQRPWI